MSVSRVDPESAVRLRECLTALSAHDQVHVLRAELRYTEGSDGAGAGVTLLVTHSLGPEHEEKFARWVAEGLAAIGFK